MIQMNIVFDFTILLDKSIIYYFVVVLYHIYKSLIKLYQ